MSGVLTVYLVVEDDGMVVDVFDVPEVVFDVVFAGADAGGVAGAEGAVDGV